MSLIKKYKGIILALVIFLVAMFGYNIFNTNVEFAEEGLVAQSIGTDIIDLNARIERVNLDPSLFSSATFKSLIDYSAVIPPQPVGRANPFDQVGR